MNRRKFLGTAAGAVVAGRIAQARAARELLVAEPVHSTGYLPLYIAMAKGYFDDVTVKIVTIESGGGHTNAVLSGQAFAFIGGPEHNAYAKAKGAELRAVVNCVNRGNIYFCAGKGQEPTGTDWPAYFKGKTSVTARPRLVAASGSVSLSSSLPLCNSITASTSDSPRPVPGFERLSSSRTKRLSVAGRI